MFGDDFFDAFVAGGYLPGVRSVTLDSADGVTAAGVVLDARQEPITEEMMALSGIEAGTEAVVYAFPVAQSGYVRPRNRWKITDGQDGTTWIVVKDDLTIQARLTAVSATRDHR